MHLEVQKTGNICIDVILNSMRRTIVAVQKLYVKYYTYVLVALFIQHAKRMRRIILSPVACLALPFFTTLFRKQEALREKSY